VRACDVDLVSQRDARVGVAQAGAKQIRQILNGLLGALR
jgi:hypothetical protein